MALLIYMKGDPKAIIVKGNMKELEKMLDAPVSENHQFFFEEWYGDRIAFFNPKENWTHVLEKKDSAVQKQLDGIKKKQAEQQDAMDRAQGKKMIQTLNPFPGRRGH